VKSYQSFILLIAVSFATGCNAPTSDAEEKAGIMLDEARVLLANQNYAAARDTILSLRSQYPTALAARRAAILTLDSVELMETRDSVERYEESLNAARESFKTMLPRENGKTNEAYYDQQRTVYQMEQHFDELCAKVKFFLRKIDIDKEEK